MFEKFDGSAREPRAAQIATLSWLADNWGCRFLALQEPTGTGKSAIARAIQLETDAAIITPNNALLDQYGRSYPELNTLRGAATYPCGYGEDHSHCDDSCEYRRARVRAETEPTVYNPMSYIYGPIDAGTVIVDEAHKLIDFLRLLIGYSFPKTRYNPPTQPDVNWVRSQVKVYNSIGSKHKLHKDVKKASLAFQSAKRLKRVVDLLEGDPESYVTYWKDQAWIVEPVHVPRDVIERVFGDAKRIILMSATLPKLYAHELLGGREFRYLDSPSPIPKENRKILADAAGLTAGSTPLEVAQWIKKQLERYQGNAIVHLTYTMGLEVAKFFPQAHIHTKQTKQRTLDDFKKHGGLWIAAGVSEGIDLAGDYGRVNLIPILPFANNRDPVGVVKFTQDPYRYYLDTAVNFIQQAGRTTRGVDDWSVTVCGDSRLIWLLRMVEKDLPRSFKESIKWS